MLKHNVELLAPAGKMEVLQAVADAGADAVYIGGKNFNMRMLRSDFNFSEEEIIQASYILHEQGKKLYVTVNNLYCDQEMNLLADYLFFLEQADVDALIVQDPGVAWLVREMDLRIPLHASVQMGVSSSEAVNLLQEQGFRRVILSKNLSLEEIRSIYKHSKLDIEYFVHGDLCISHAGQCWMSSFLAGASGNRGMCRKPCRWPYQFRIQENAVPEGFYYWLAHHDLCLYPYLSELVQAGVSSLKIEGRMREASYLRHIVSIYREALDRMAADGDAYTMNEEAWSELQEHRVRNYTAGSLLGRTGPESIGYDGKREPPFPTAALPLTPILRDLSEDKRDNGIESSLDIPIISVKVANPEAAQQAIDAGADRLIFGLENLRQLRFAWNEESLQAIIEDACRKEVDCYLELPRIVTQQERSKMNNWLSLAEKVGADGVIVHEWGSFYYFTRHTRIDVQAGSGLNLCNQKAIDWVMEQGASSVSLSLELPGEHILSALSAVHPLEVYVQGPLFGMVMDYCLPGAAYGVENHTSCTIHCRQDALSLEDQRGNRYPVLTDSNCRNYVLYPLHRCFLLKLPELMQKGVRSLRLDGILYSNEQLFSMVALYKQTLQDIQQGKNDMNQELEQLHSIVGAALSDTPW